MNDLMNCQMCGGKAKHIVDHDFGKTWVCCQSCGCVSNVVSSYETDQMPMDEFEAFEAAHEGMRPDDWQAVTSWNAMHTYIARGKLLDDAPKSKDSRL